MKKLLIAALMVASSAAIAIPSPLPKITGVMDFEGDLTVLGDLQTGNALLKFTNVLNDVGDREGDYATVLQGNFAGNFFDNIFIAGGAPVTPISPLWQVQDSFVNGSEIANFDLLAITYFDAVDFDNDGNTDFLNLAGTGTARLTGFAETTGTFFLSSQDRLLSFSADSVSVASPGTMALLGMGLVGLGLARRKAGV